VVSTGPGAYSVNGTHTYAEEGSKSVTFSVADDAPGTATAGATSTANIADALLFASGSTLNENATQPFTATIATFTDADPNGTTTDYSATINWNDASAPTTGTVSANGSGGFNVTGTHTYAAPGTYHPVVTINDSGGASTTATATVNAGEADLSISMSGNPSPVQTHTKLTYKITIKNNGPTAALNVMLTDTLSPASTFVSMSPSTGCVTPAKGKSGTITCSLGTLASGTSKTLTVVVFVTAPAGSSITNSASVSSSTFDPVLANNHVSVKTSVRR
jgi:uncharacterized repeat protein (TIGR01451 family)